MSMNAEQRIDRARELRGIARDMDILELNARRGGEIQVAKDGNWWMKLWKPTEEREKTPDYEQLPSSVVQEFSRWAATRRNELEREADALMKSVQVIP